MSEQTKAALDAAIAAHVADDRPGHYVSGYLLQVVGNNLEDRLSWYQQYFPESQPFHVTAGLATVADMAVSDYWQNDDD